MMGGEIRFTTPLIFYFFSLFDLFAFSQPFNRKQQSQMLRMDYKRLKTEMVFVVVIIVTYLLNCCLLRSGYFRGGGGGLVGIALIFLKILNRWSKSLIKAAGFHLEELDCFCHPLCSLNK